MSDLSKPQDGNISGRGEPKTFATLEDAFGFLDEEREEVERMLRLYHGHVKELMTQIVNQFGKPKRKRKADGN